MAMGTTSSLLAPVGIESTLAGCASTLHSLASAAAVTCAIIIPEFTPGSFVRNAGRPSFHVRVGQAIDCARSEITARLVTAMARKSSAMETDWPVEVAAAQQVGVEHERVVGRRVQLAADDARGKSMASSTGPVHLRHAAQAVRILHSRVVVTMRFANLAVGEQFAEKRGRRGLTELPARILDARIESDGRPEQRFERHRAGDVRRSPERVRVDERQRADRRMGLRPVMSVSPSLLANVIG
jgi:hypothetical protein